MKDEYERLACKVLGLQHPDTAEGIHLHLGTFRIGDSFEATKYVTSARFNRVRDMLGEEYARSQDEELYKERQREYQFYTLGGYIKYIRDIHEDPNFATPDLRGYNYYLKKRSPKTYKLIDLKVPALLSESDRTQHTYCIAGTGSGKTELLKIICWETLEAGHAAVVVIDPLGALARPLSHWPEFKDRLVYIDPTLDLNHMPTINPLEYTPNSPNPHAQEDERDTIAEEITAVFRQLIEATDGSLSENMEAVLLPCIKVLLTIPGSSFRDLQRFMNGDQNSDLLTAASRYPYLDSGVREFFRTTFEDPHVKPTRRALNVKLQKFVNNRIFYNLLCGKSTINLQKEIDAKKLIIFNLSGMRGKTQEQFGRFVLATVQSIGHRRANATRRVPCHVIVDECSQFITSSIEKILNQGRQLGMHLTLCQQVVGGNMPMGMVNVVTGNSYVKIIGATEGGERSPASMLGLHANELRHIKRGEFFIKAGPKPTFKLAIREDLLGNARGMNDKKWDVVVKDQLFRYYRPLPEDAEFEDIPVTSTALTEYEEGW